LAKEDLGTNQRKTEGGRQGGKIGEKQGQTGAEGKTNNLKCVKRRVVISKKPNRGEKKDGWGKGTNKRKGRRALREKKADE